MCELNCRSAGSHVFIPALLWTMRAQQMRASSTGPTATGQQLCTLDLIHDYAFIPLFISSSCQIVAKLNVVFPWGSFQSTKSTHKPQTVQLEQIPLCISQTIKYRFMWHQSGLIFQLGPKTCESTFESNVTKITLVTLGQFCSVPRFERINVLPAFGVQHLLRFKPWRHLTLTGLIIQLQTFLLITAV